jgi:hypothetical protein
VAEFDDLAENGNFGVKIMMDIRTIFVGFFGGNLVEISYQIIHCRFFPVTSKNFSRTLEANGKTREFD